MRTRSAVRDNLLSAQHLPDAKYMVTVAYGNAGPHAIGTHNCGHAPGRFGCVGTLRLGDELRIGNAQSLQVFPAHHAFGEIGIRTRAAGGNHNRRQPLVVQQRRVIQPRLVHRRGLAAILRRAKDHNRIGLVGLILSRLMDHPRVYHRHPGGSRQHYHQQPFAPECFRHQCRNSASSLSGIAPWRRMEHFPGSLISMMVEATSRGLTPPSTIRLMLVPSCMRTPSAVVHSLAPLMLAEVAVIGTPAARITSTGIREAGTRSATLPVLAVTFSGRREEAFTMIVSGPGQYLLVIS